MGDSLEYLSAAVGWIYFFAWSISFYGQIYVNWKKKNVEGMKLDFAVYNFTGFCFYSIYSGVGFWTTD